MNILLEDSLCESSIEPFLDFDFPIRQAVHQLSIAAPYAFDDIKYKLLLLDDIHVTSMFFQPNLELLQQTYQL